MAHNRPEKSVVGWFKDNVLALLLICVSGVGTYTLAVNRITVLEVKVEQQERQAIRTEDVIQNNTDALNKIAVIFARINGKMDTFNVRIASLEDK
jgi:hypothetical protein